MSKTSISRDRWRQSGQTRAAGTWCPGCGLHAHVNAGQHRTDCTAPDPKPTITPKATA